MGVNPKAFATLAERAGERGEKGVYHRGLALVQALGTGGSRFAAGKFGKQGCEGTLAAPGDGFHEAVEDRDDGVPDRVEGEPRVAASAAGTAQH